MLTFLYRFRYRCCLLSNARCHAIEQGALPYPTVTREQGGVAVEAVFELINAYVFYRRGDEHAIAYLFIHGM